VMEAAGGLAWESAGAFEAGVCAGEMDAASSAMRTMSFID